jgi:hypothetical protein
MGESMKSIIQHTFVLAVSFAVLAGCARGKTGPAGADGAGKIVSTVNCSGTIFGLSGQAGTSLNGLRVEYQSVLTSGGDVYATANIADDFAQVSETAFYANEQTGADEATVELIGDYDQTDDGATWEVSLNRDTLITTVTYTDSSLGFQSPVVLNFTAAACSQHNW